MINPNTKILILNQDRILSHQLDQALTECGHSVSVCYSSEQGLLQAVGEKFDLILLEHELPKKDALVFLRSLRQSRWTPVVVMDSGGYDGVYDSRDNAQFTHSNRELLGADRTYWRLEVFRCGADDYWIKPFNFTEIQLRVAAILRRSLGWSSGPDSRDTLQVGSLQLNRRELKVRVNQQEAALTQVQFKLLWYLASHQNEVLPKGYLHTLVLEKPYCRHDRSIDMHLSRVRKKLVDLGLAADRVQTVHGKGYCFA